MTSELVIIWAFFSEIYNYYYYMYLQKKSKTSKVNQHYVLNILSFS